MSNNKLSDAFQSSTAGIEHVTVSMSLPYDRLVSAFEAELGHLDPAVTKALVERRASWGEVEKEIERIGGVHGLMVIASANQGVVTSLSGKMKRCLLYLSRQSSNRRQDHRHRCSREFLCAVSCCHFR